MPQPMQYMQQQLPMQPMQQQPQIFWGTLPQNAMSQQMPSSTSIPPQMPTSNPMSSHNPQALTIGSTASSSSNWYPDSGASHHVTSNVENIQQCAPFEGPDQVIIGNGQGFHIHSIGSTSFLSPFNKNTNLMLNMLLHVPTISKNLLSVSQFAKDNSIYFEFHPNTCLVKSQGSNEILLKGHLGSDGLYKFPHMLYSSSAPTSSSFRNVSFNSALHSSLVNTASLNFITTSTWHSRIGHPSAATQNLVMQLRKIPLMNKNELDFCCSCCLGKAHRLHAPYLLLPILNLLN